MAMGEVRQDKAKDGETRADNTSLLFFPLVERTAFERLPIADACLVNATALPWR